MHALLEPGRMTFLRAESSEMGVSETGAITESGCEKKGENDTEQKRDPGKDAGERSREMSA